MHLHNKLLQCTNDLTTLTNIRKLRKLWDIFYIHGKMKFKSNIYIKVHLKMVVGSSSPRKQNLLHGAKSTESTEPPAGCIILLIQLCWTNIGFGIVTLNLDIFQIFAPVQASHFHRTYFAILAKIC